MTDDWDGPRDSDGEPCYYLNRYECHRCGTTWDDLWSCSCNDRCPNCDVETEPYDFEYLGPDRDFADRVRDFKDRNSDGHY